jgi:cytoskeletal protein CcmA (bactofilin family)
MGDAVSGNSRDLVIREDAIIKGEIRNCRQMEVYGYVEGDVAAESVLIHDGGRCHGTIRTDSAEVHGTLQGNVFVKHLINIHSSGDVSGNVRYGRLSMALGANLSAEVRNVPPTIAGDLDLSVQRGRAVRITLQDLTALDPDDSAQNLTFSVSRFTNGFVSLSGTNRPVSNFTQADLQNGDVIFMHDGTDTKTASFDVVVADRAGATSGAAQTVRVAVKA